MPDRRDFVVGGNYLFAAIALIRKPAAVVGAVVAGGFGDAADDGTVLGEYRGFSLHECAAYVRGWRWRI